MSFYNWFFKQRRPLLKGLRPILSVELLEDRTCPIIGSIFPPVDGMGLPVPAPDFGPGNYIYQDLAGTEINLSGVVRIDHPYVHSKTGVNPQKNVLGSGSLIQTVPGLPFGSQILTVAHNLFFADIKAHSNHPFKITFSLGQKGNPIPIPILVPANTPANQYSVLGNYSSFVFEAPDPDREVGFVLTKNDVAIVRLTDQRIAGANRLLVAPYTAKPYALYTPNLSAEVGKNITIAGYGLSGNGAVHNNPAWSGSGASISKSPAFFAGKLRVGENTLDALAGDVFLLDFDDVRNAKTDALGFYGFQKHAGLPLGREAFFSFGDSGGPAFIGNLLAGVISKLSNVPSPPDVDQIENSTFGEIGQIQRVSSLVADKDAGQSIRAAMGYYPGGKPIPYHIVLDMNQQVLGNDGISEDLTIKAKRTGKNLELWVEGSADTDLKGMYCRFQLATFASGVN